MKIRDMTKNELSSYIDKYMKRKDHCLPGSKTWRKHYTRIKKARKAMLSLSD